MDALTSVFGLSMNYDPWDKQKFLPLYIASGYHILQASLGDYRFIILSPKEELVSLPALKKQIKKIQEIDNIPVVIKLPSVSIYRRKNLIENKIPFITNKQAFLPFIGAFLTQENDEPQGITKFMFSTQLLVLMYLYNGNPELYVSEATKKLPFTAMTMSRAVKQLEATGLFQITKDGVNKVIKSDLSREELFEKAKEYMSSPVRKVGYLLKSDITDNLLLAGDSVLAEETMLNANRIQTYAGYIKTFDVSKMMNELLDPDKQIRIELWEYDPALFSDNHMADKLSVALSYIENADERVEEAVEELVKGIWDE